MLAFFGLIVQLYCVFRASVCNVRIRTSLKLNVRIKRDVCDSFCDGDVFCCSASDRGRGRDGQVAGVRGGGRGRRPRRAGGRPAEPDGDGQGRRGRRRRQPAPSTHGLHVSELSRRRVEVSQGAEVVGRIAPNRWSGGVGQPGWNTCPTLW